MDTENLNMTDFPIKFEDGRVGSAKIIPIEVEKYKKMAVEETAKALILGKKIQNAPSNSIGLDEIFTSFGLSEKVIAPPFDPIQWSLAPEKSPRLARAISAWARNTVGLGWKIVPKDFSGNPIDLGDPKNKAAARQFEKEKNSLLMLFKFPNMEMPFVKIMELIKKDEESTGNAYLEVVRNNLGRIVSLYHVPAISVRVLKDNKGFVQIRGLQFNSSEIQSSTVSQIVNGATKDSVRYFKNFGDPAVMDKKTGRTAGRISIQNRATEIIHFKIYSPRSTTYGVPRYISAAPAIIGNRIAAERNVAWFENDSTPRAILSVTGGKLDNDSIERVESFFRQQTQGAENAGRLLVLQVTQKSTGLGKESSSNIQFQPITVGITEDASFLGYKGANDTEIREVMEIGEPYFSVDTVNRAAAETSKAITETQSFEPDRINKEYIINNTIVADPGWLAPEGEGMGIEIAHLEFLRPRSLDPMELAQIDSLYAEMGVKTVNEVRISLGMDPYPPEFGFGNKPLIVALEELRAGITPTTGDENYFDKLRAEEQKIAMAQAKASSQNKGNSKVKKNIEVAASGLIKSAERIKNAYMNKTEEDIGSAISDLQDSIKSLTENTEKIRKNIKSSRKLDK